ncbi:peptidase inhibitor family I36 protein [Streptomyces rochei]|uniref:peptidase inhibitor family I36 protein n=1 Tax=Streptomyces rochei TaxID=1928 RepID=UPI00362843C2
MTVTVYADVDYKGKSATLGEGRHKLDSSMNDCISSVRVPSGWKVTLFEHADFTGAQVTLEADTPKLEGDLHDKASSIVVAETDGRPEHVFSDPNGDDWFYFEDSYTSTS